MHHNRSYYLLCDNNDNTYLNKLKVQILEVGKDENGDYSISDKTIFHLQGGGQPMMKVILKRATGDIQLSS